MHELDRLFDGDDVAREVNVDVVNRIKSINTVIRDWCEYYKFANISDIFNKLDWWINRRMYLWLKKKHSNVSAKMSVSKFVCRTYLTTSSKGWKTWGYAGVNLRHTYETKHSRYRVNWGKERNPYLDYDAFQRFIKEEKPLEDNIWNGIT